MYEGDVPLAERRAQALSLDRSLLAEIMGRQELRELIDEDALTSLELDLQLLSEERKIRNVDFLHDALRLLGDLSAAEVAARLEDPGLAATWLAELEEARRAIKLRIAGEERWTAVEDAARFRDALGVALPMGLPQAFLDPVDDPLADLIARYARTHGPFLPGEPAERLGLGVGVVERVLKQLDSEGRVMQGEFRPGGNGTEWVDVEVLRKLRRRSLAAFRKEVEPVPPEVLARFSLAWQGVGPTGPRDASIEALYGVLQQLQGAPLPASAFESQILPARLPGYSPALLDELGATGEIVWAGVGAIGSSDGWITVATAADAAQLIPPPSAEPSSPLAMQIQETLSGGGALFFRQLSDAMGSTDDPELLLALWELVWSGWVTNDTLAPVRALLGGRPRTSHSRRRRANLPSRLGPPSGVGRWSLVPERETSPTRRLHSTSQQMLTRYGIVTRGSVQAERVGGGFAAVYGVLRALEDAGRCRRGYFVEGLGGAQFALAGAVDRMRALTDVQSGAVTQVLAAADPANPFGAALPWPEREEGGHRAGRKAGAVVVLVDGHLVFYVEKGGKSLLSYSDDVGLVQPAVDALVLAARDGMLGRLSVERADGEPVLDAPFAGALMEAGFRPTSRGLRLRA
jgi:ATP-dependent Lhr-like helicase